MRRLSPAAVAIATVVALVCPAAHAANPLAGQRIFLDCQASTEQTAPQYNPWYWLHHYQGVGDTKAALIAKIAKVPVAKWFAGDGVRPLPTKLEDRYLARVDDPQV